MRNRAWPFRSSFTWPCPSQLFATSNLCLLALYIIVGTPLFLLLCALCRLQILVSAADCMSIGRSLV